MNIQRLLFYTRPVETGFHIRLSELMRTRFPQAEIVFATFFSQSAEYLRAEGLEVAYLPELLNQCDVEGLSETRLREIDRFCRSRFHGLNTMLRMERFLPEDREETEMFFRRHLTVLDQLVVPGTLGVSAMYDHFIYLTGGMLAFEKGGAHFAFVGCGVPAGRVNGLKIPCELWERKGGPDDAEALFDHCREEILQPPEQRIEYMKPETTVRPLSVPERIATARRRAAFGKYDYKQGSYFARLQMNWFSNAFYWRLRLVRERLGNGVLWDLAADADLQKISGPCVYMALHMEPEATILMYSPRLRDQREACRLVAEVLPVGYTLLVKENPKMAGKRPPGYYAAFQRFQNVRLCAPTVSSVRLIERSEAVVSLGGTVTLEARLRGKRAYCLGYPPFWRIANACGHGILEELGRLDEQRGSSECLAGTDESWRKWIRGTFIGKANRSEFSRFFGQYVKASFLEDVQGYADFIWDCLSNDQERDS